MLEQLGSLDEEEFDYQNIARESQIKHIITEEDLVDVGHEGLEWCAKDSALLEAITDKDKIGETSVWELVDRVRGFIDEQPDHLAPELKDLKVDNLDALMKAHEKLMEILKAQVRRDIEFWTSYVDGSVDD